MHLHFAKFQNCEIVKFPNWDIAKLQNCQIAEWPNWEIAKFPNLRNFLKIFWLWYFFRGGGAPPSHAPLMDSLWPPKSKTERFRQTIAQNSRGRLVSKQHLWCVEIWGIGCSSCSCLSPALFAVTPSCLASKSSLLIWFDTSRPLEFWAHKWVF